MRQICLTMLESWRNDRGVKYHVDCQRDLPGSRFVLYMRWVCVCFMIGELGILVRYSIILSRVL